MRQSLLKNVRVIVSIVILVYTLYWEVIIIIHTSAIFLTLSIPCFALPKVIFQNQVSIYKLKDFIFRRTKMYFFQRKGQNTGKG